MNQAVLNMDLHKPTFTCKTSFRNVHLSLDQACLHVYNKDPKLILDLYAQAEECYKCSPWHYLTLHPQSKESLAVNTTYPTILTVSDGDRNITYRYLFGEYGAYSLSFNSTSFGKMRVSHLPVNSAMPILVAAVFFGMLVFIWQGVKFLMRRMDASCRVRQVDSQSEPLVNDVGTVASTSRASNDLSSVPRQRSSRVISLDAFRGFAIVIMIFVNYGGGNYYFFKHARWNGLTVADLVFPWFMWIMGVSLTISVRSQLRRATRRHTIAFRILKRSIILFFLGLVINSIKSNHLPTLRVMGVLQRFSLCYLVSAMMEAYLMEPQDLIQYVWYWRFRSLVLSWPQWGVTLVMVITHTIITFLLDIPGCPKGYLGPGGLHEWSSHPNCTGGATGYIDRRILGTNHIYQHPTCRVIYNNPQPFDPEGLFGVLTSCLGVQLGVAAGRILLTYERHYQRIKRWLIWGVVTGLVAGILCGFSKENGVIPVNKNLWSLSYVLCTASFAFILLSFFYFCIDAKQWWSGSPFHYAGMNAILLYIGHEITGKLFPWSWSPVGKYHSSYLMMNIWGTTLWMITAYILHEKKMFFAI